MVLTASIPVAPEGVKAKTRAETMMPPISCAMNSMTARVVVNTPVSHSATVIAGLLEQSCQPVCSNHEFDVERYTLEETASDSIEHPSRDEQREAKRRGNHHDRLRVEWRIVPFRLDIRPRQIRGLRCAFSLSSPMVRSATLVRYVCRRFCP